MQSIVYYNIYRYKNMVCRDILGYYPKFKKSDESILLISPYQVIIECIHDSYTKLLSLISLFRNDNNFEKIWTYLVAVNS